MTTSAKNYYEYRIVEFKDEYDNLKFYLCFIKFNGKYYGDAYEARDIESTFAWLRLMLGAYPGSTMNDEGAAA